MKSEIKTILIEKDEILRLSDIDFTFLHNILQFLKPFTECSEFLSTKNTPTMSYYLLWYQNILKHCSVESIDSSVILDVKRITRAAIIKRMYPEQVHYIGLFLNSSFKEITFCTIKQREIQNFVKL